MCSSIPSLSYPLAKERKLQTLRIKGAMTWKSLEARGSVTLSLNPHPPSAAALGCTGVGGGTSTLLLGPLDVWIYVMEQMVLLILTDLYRCPVCGVGKCTRSPEFHPGPSFHDKQ